MLVAAALLGGTLTGQAVAGAKPAGSSDGCVLPQLNGTPLNVAEQVLPHLGCALGAITRQPSISIHKNAVIMTRPPAGRYQRNRRIELVVSGGPAAAVHTSTITGKGTNDDPYTGPCGTRVDGACRITFQSRHLNAFLTKHYTEYVPAYRCPHSDPWLLKKTVTEGRRMPPGVLFETSGQSVDASITGMSKKEGKQEQRGHKVYVFEYATGTLTGFPNSGVFNWGARSADYTISIFCTADLAKAQLVDVRG